jgi:hypothetical protein
MEMAGMIQMIGIGGQNGLAETNATTGWVPEAGGSHPVLECPSVA